MMTKMVYFVDHLLHSRETFESIVDSFFALYNNTYIQCAWFNW